MKGVGKENRNKNIEFIILISEFLVKYVLFLPNIIWKKYDFTYPIYSVASKVVKPIIAQDTLIKSIFQGLSPYLHNHQ